MKIRFLNKTLPLFLLLIISSACGSKKSVSAEVIKPSIVSVHPTIKNIGIINRSIPSEKNKFLADLDKILSIEGANLDKEGAEQSVLALKNELSKNAKFTTVNVIETGTELNPGGGVFPAPFSWDVVKSICVANNVDAIFELSVYDTDATADYDTFQGKIQGPLGIEIPGIQHRVSISTVIKTGWRIYDPVNKVISDEFAIDQKTNSTGSGINPLKALEAANDRKQSVLQISQKIAENYAQRLLPYKDTVYRKYYTSSTENFEVARRYVETGKWDKAAELWKTEVANNDPEIAGEACFNMAFYNEIKGDYKNAIEWATKSYTEFKNKRGLKYIEDLEERIDDNIKLAE